MKGKKSFLILLMACAMVVVFCLPGAVFAKGPNSGVVPVGSKLIGPLLKGVLILGWKTILDDGVFETGIGDVEALLYLEGKFYYAIYDKFVPETTVEDDGFLETTAADITGGTLPCQIAEDYGMGICGGTGEAVIWEEKDVANFVPQWNVAALGVPGFQSYKHVLSCEVKISFLIPKK